MNTRLPRLLITPGEPAGIGPELLAMINRQSFEATLVAVADPELLQQRIEHLGLDIRVREYRDAERHRPGIIDVMPVPLRGTVTAGQLNPENAAYVLATLDTAVSACLDHRFDALITGPVSKSIINTAGIPFSGHTEYLAEKCGAALPVMMLTNTRVRVALVTTHLPLKDVVGMITPQRLEQVISILHGDLQSRFALQAPRIAVCGLNPHAGEDGHLGTEEITVLRPVIERLCQQGLRLSGPLPADTVFTPEVRRDFDVILAMYHDQGLTALKALGFGETVNITLGLPVIRTSVDHGTALALAGTGKANPSSLVAAIEQAIAMLAHAQPGQAGKSDGKPRSALSH